MRTKMPYGSCYATETYFNSIQSIPNYFPRFIGIAPTVFIKEKKETTPIYWESDVDIHLDMELLGNIVELRITFLLERIPKVYVAKIRNYKRFLKRLLKTENILLNFFDEDEKPHTQYFIPHFLEERAKEILKKTERRKK